MHPSLDIKQRFSAMIWIYRNEIIPIFDEYINLVRLETLIITNIISGGSLLGLQTLGRESFKLHPMAQFALSDFQWTWEVKRALQMQYFECLNRDCVNSSFFGPSCYVNLKIVYISISLCHWRFRILEMREVEVSFFDIYLFMWHPIRRSKIYQNHVSQSIEYFVCFKEIIHTIIMLGAI